MVFVSNRFGTYGATEIMILLVVLCDGLLLVCRRQTSWETTALRWFVYHGFSNIALAMPFLADSAIGFIGVVIGWVWNHGTISRVLRLSSLSGATFLSTWMGVTTGLLTGGEALSIWAWIFTALSAVRVSMFVLVDAPKNH
jgi:hypothetical protein